jgi:ribosomal protein S18 acetylase RimI-like enzyme
MALIRDAVAADAPRLAEIHAVAWRAAYRGLLSNEYLAGLTPTTRLDWWNSRLARVPPRWAILVAEDEGEVVGFVTIGHCDDDDRRPPFAGELYAMYVDPDRWGLGFGRELLFSAEDRFRADAYRDASLWVLRDNQRARRFYERGGWHNDLAEQRLVIGSDAVTAVRYLRYLEAPR